MLVLYILAFIIGVTSGLVTFIFGSGLSYISNIIFILFPYNLILLPIVGIITLYLKNNLNEEVAGSMGKVFMATKKNNSLSYLIIPFQLITTWLAHLAGASVGREGVAVQLGATISNVTGSWVPDVDNRSLTKLGMAAGFAGLFGTPFAATIFCFEATRTKALSFHYVLATLFAALTASYTSTLLGLAHFHVKVGFTMLDIRQLCFLGFSVTVFVFFGNLFAYCLAKMKSFYNQFELKEAYKILIFTAVGAFLLFVINDGRYMSLGTNIIDDAFYNPQNISFFDSFLKLGFTVFFVGIGFQGGEVTPLFAIGASLGVTLGYIFAIPYAILGAIGYAFMFGNATNAYFACSVIAIEIFGVGVLPYVAISLLLTLILKSNKYSIYPNCSN